MERIFYLSLAAILFTGCAVIPQQPGEPGTGSLEKTSQNQPSVAPEPKITIQGELLNEPPENPRFVVAQSPDSNTAEQVIAESIKRQLEQFGYVEAATRDDANVVVWYRYDSAQTGQRSVGQAKDVWGEQLSPVAAFDPNTIIPVSFKVELVSLEESRFPHQVIPVWRGEWSSTLPVMSMANFSSETLPQVLEQYQSEETQSQIAAFRQARERKVTRAINTYMAMVMYRIQKHWQKPKKNVKGKKCKVKIEQSAVGEIRSHTLLACDKDWRFRRSIEKAIKQSSPLPMPKEDLFDRSELILIFQG